MSVTDGIGQTPCSFEHYLVFILFLFNEFISQHKHKYNNMTGEYWPNGQHTWGRWSVGPKILVGWATMHLAPPISGLYVR